MNRNKKLRIKIKNRKGIYDEWTGIMPADYNLDKCVEFIIDKFNYRRMLYRDFAIFTASNNKKTERILYEFKLIDEIIKRRKVANYRNN